MNRRMGCILSSISICILSGVEGASLINTVISLIKRGGTSSIFIPRQDEFGCHLCFSRLIDRYITQKYPFEALKL
jgi:hypothetical protein